MTTIYKKMIIKTKRTTVKNLQKINRFWKAREENAGRDEHEPKDGES